MNHNLQTAQAGQTAVNVPLVSIIINNYNYARFLGRAIASALAQTYRPLQVIVVDDGSTDHSRKVIAEVIAEFGDQVLPVLKANGGQASAFNAGFAASQGDVVIFLDADDELAPHVAAATVATFAAQPDVVRVQYRLEIVDAEGQRLGQTKPPQAMPIPVGDLRQAVLHHGDDIAWLPTSGNAFAATVLRQILPMPEADYRICADYYLSNLSPLYGPVAALAQPGGCYRVHGANSHQTSAVHPRQLRQIITQTAQTHRHVQRAAQALGLLADASAPVGTRSLSFLANRLVSLRLEPAQHPLPADRRMRLAWAGMMAAIRRNDLMPQMRLAYIGWFGAVALVPQRVVPGLAELLFYPDTRRQRMTGWLARLRQAWPVTLARGGRGGRAA